MAKKTNKDLLIEDLETQLQEQTTRAKAGRILAGKLFCHLIEVNKWLSFSNEVDRHYGSVESHIDFNNRMIEIIRSKLKQQGSINVTINGRN
jgi:hypothetical protein